MSVPAQRVVAVATIAYVAVLGAIAERHGPFPLNVVDVVPTIYAGVVTVVAALLVARWRPDNNTAWLLAIAGWFVLARGLAWSNVDLLFTLGGVLSGVDYAVFAHVVLALPSGRLASLFDRTLVVVFYATALASGVVPNLFFECQSEFGFGCPGNLILIDADPDRVAVAEDVFGLVAASVLTVYAVRLVWRWREAGAPLRRVLGPSLVAGAGVVATGVIGVLGLWDVHADLAGLVEPLVVTLLPIAVLVGILNSKARAGDIGALVTAAPVHSGDLRRDLERLLAAASGDPTICLLGAEAAADPEPRLGRVRTPVDGEDGRLAVLDHDLALTSEPEVLDAVVATARLVLDRERLAERVQRQLQDVNASRVRLLAAEDNERRRIERDLHDGVQQHLVASGLLLGMALDSDGDAELVRDAATEVEAATRALRALARGVHPTLVSERGLAAAVESLAERATFPVDVVGEVDHLPALVGVTAYFVVAEALTNVSKHADATRVIVTLAMRGDDVSVEVADDGRGGAAPELGSGVVGLRDRVEAIGGQFDVVSRLGVGTTITALLPVGDRSLPQMLDAGSEVQP